MINKVGVIIPIFNGAEYLEDCLNSVISQTHKDLEIVIINDNSTDNTLQIAENFRDNHPDHIIKIITNYTNIGPGPARNLGERFLSSDIEFIAFLDHDDLWEPNKLRIQLERFLDPTVGLVHSRLSEYGTNKIWGHFLEGDVFSKTIQNICCVTSTVVVRRSILRASGGYAEDVYIGEDWILWVNISAMTRFSCVDLPLTIRRLHKDQISNDLQRTIKCNDIVNAYILKKYRDRLNKEDISNMTFNDLMSKGYYYRIIGSIPKSVQSYILAWKQRPYKLQALRGAFRSLI